MIALPVIALAILLILGLGPATMLARRSSPAAQVALAAPLSAGVLACASSLVYLGISTKLIWVVVVALLACCTIASARRLPRSPTSFAGPVAVSFVALALASVPFFNLGGWGVATFSNTDPYVWVSQATSLLDGVPAGDPSLHPDRIAYDRIADEHWPTGLPFTLAGVALLADADPVDVYGAFAALLAALLGLAVFFCAAGVLLWRSTLATIAGAAVGANGYLLFGTFFGWQAQIALATFGALSVFCFRLALDSRDPARERLLTGLFVAAGLATYGWPYVTFAGLLLATLCGYLVSHGLAVWRRAAAVTAWCAITAVLIGGLPLLELLRAFASSSVEWTEELSRTWSRYDQALPHDSLGFVPRTEALMQTRPDLGLAAIVVVILFGIVAVAAGLTRRRTLATLPGFLLATGVVLAAAFASLRVGYVLPSEWPWIAAAVTVPILAAGLASTRGFRNPRGDVLAACTLFLGAALVAFFLLDLTPLYSIRLMGYAVPLLTLLALSPLAARRTRSGPGLRRVGRVLPLAAGLALFCLASAAAIRQGSSNLRTTDEVEATALAAVAAEPRGAIEIAVSETWVQAWLVYFLREREVLLPEPSLYFTGFTTATSREVGDRSRRPAYRIRPRSDEIPEGARFPELELIVLTSGSGLTDNRRRAFVCPRRLQAVAKDDTSWR